MHARITSNDLTAVAALIAAYVLSARLGLSFDPLAGVASVVWLPAGIGIAQNEIERAFEPFFQAERGTTRRFSGVGLGLTIARDLARQMNGEVTIASEVGTGTTASVLLPAA